MEVIKCRFITRSLLSVLGQEVVHLVEVLGDSDVTVGGPELQDVVLAVVVIVYNVAVLTAQIVQLFSLWVLNHLDQRTVEIDSFIKILLLDVRNIDFIRLLDLI